MGHPLYVPRNFQGAGRWDNPHHYAMLYLGETASGAIGERFGGLSRWTEDMFDASSSGAGVRYSLGVYETPPTLDLIDLDDPQTLVDRGWRSVAQVAGRDRAFTQSVALEMFLDGAAEGVRAAGYYRPQWFIVGLWDGAPAANRFAAVEVVEVVPLSIDTPAVVTAAEALHRVIGQT